jgi:hypothetical protein
MILLGVDPGKTVGLAVYNTITEEMMGSQIVFDDFGDWLNLSLGNVRKDPNLDQDIKVACERYAIRSLKYAADAHWAIEIIGITRYLCKCYSVPLTLQHAGVAKQYANDIKLRKAKWYVPGRDHANDAIRHVALLMASQKIVPPWAA